MIPKWAYYLQQGAGVGSCGTPHVFFVAIKDSVHFQHKCTKAARHALMTEQLNETGFYYHNVEAETIIWVRIRVHQQQWAFTSSKTTAFKADWIGPWDDDHIFYKKKKDAANWVCPSVSLHVNHCASGKLRTSWVPSLQVLFSLIASCHIIHFH